MTTSIDSEKIVLNFAWEGPSALGGGWSKGGINVGVVDLLFKDAKTEVSVSIPEEITTRSLAFTCRKYSENEVEFNGRKFKPLIKESQTDKIKVSVEQIRNLVIKAGFFTLSPYQGAAVVDSSGKITREKRVLRSDRDVSLRLPDMIEAGNDYSLIINSEDLSLSARLDKVKNIADSTPPHKKAARDELHRRMKIMGQALISERIDDVYMNLSRADSSQNPLPSDVVAHGMQAVLRAAQKIHPDLEVPNSKPLETPDDLDLLSTEELQSRFNETFIKDKKFETQRINADTIEQINQIVELELANSQLLVRIAEALKRRGIQPVFPESEDFKSAEEESNAAHAKMHEMLSNTCKMQ